MSRLRCTYLVRTSTIIPIENTMLARSTSKTLSQTDYYLDMVRNTGDRFYLANRVYLTKSSIGRRTICHPFGDRDLVIQPCEDQVLSSLIAQLLSYLNSSFE